ncbi:hypothetical protein [Halomonas aquatica]|uniref:Uncharacterized protein n=1 Tax=Halomonas aquatica TaxID=3151123 RepID=A0ABV1NH82_9GAMM
MLATLNAGRGSRSHISVPFSHHAPRLVPTGIVYNTQTLPEATKSGSPMYDPEINIDLSFALMGDAQPSEADME